MMFRSPRAFLAIQTRRASKSAISTLAIAVVLLSPALALQVTPKSVCASLCMDTLGSDASDPNVSSTFGKDVVCKDTSYMNSPVGSKFESCLNCLQGSSASSSNENDQGWYFYNLRYAFNSCVFGTTNATDSMSTPCSTSTVCGPIQKALGDGMGTPLTTGQYSYCTAYDNSFMGGHLDTCRDCLKLNNEALYLSNFLVALQAGCTQRPSSGMVVGLNSTVFTKSGVAITFPQAAESKTHKSLSTGAIIGIAVGCGILLLIVLATLFICLRKRHNANRLKQLQSPLHERFGAENITAPTSGSFSSPRTSPLLKRDSMQMSITPQGRNFSYSRQQPQMSRDWQGHFAGTSPALLSSPPSYSPPISVTARDSVPAHHAYIAHEYTPSSRHSTSPLFVPPPPPGPPSQPSPQQAPRPVPASHPQRSLSQIMAGRSHLPVAPHPSLVRHERGASESLPATMLPPPPLARNMSSAPRLQRNLGARRGFAPSPVVIGVTPIETEDVRKARERLYRDGVGGTRAHGPETPVPERPSPESDVGSEELWPGSY